MADTTKRKTDLAYDIIRCITNIDQNKIILEKKIQMFIDNGFASTGSDPITDEILAANSDLSYLTYNKFVQAKDISDAIIALYDANSREIEIMINELRGLIGK